MSLYRGVSAGVVSSAVLLTASGAWAQVSATAEASTAAPPAAEAAAEPAPAPEAEAAPAEPAPAAAEPAPEAPAEEPAAEEEEETGPFSYLIFGDAYATVNTAVPGSPSAPWRAYEASAVVTAPPPGAAAPALAGFGAENGFGLAFAGLDLAYSAEKFGVTTSLRFGPGVTKFYAADMGGFGVGGITQAFATWKPSDKLTLDFGQFGTPFGAEVAESWINLNYTRGGLYYSMQPFWHTGLRAALALSDSVTLKGMLVDDVNSVSLLSTANGDIQAGLQLAVAAGDLGLYIGTLQTLGTQNVLFDRFFDLVVTYMPGDFSLILNADFNAQDTATELFGGNKYLGVSLAAGYAFSPVFGLAGRVEVLDYSLDDATAGAATGIGSGDEVITATVTFDVKPVKDLDNVVLRWDNRLEAALDTTPLFDGGGGATDLWFASTVGLVVKADGVF